MKDDNSADVFVVDWVDIDNKERPIPGSTPLYLKFANGCEILGYAHLGKYYYLNSDEVPLDFPLIQWGLPWHYTPITEEQERELLDKVNQCKDSVKEFSRIGPVLPLSLKPLDGLPTTRVSRSDYFGEP